MAMELSLVPLGHQQRLSSLSRSNQRHSFSKNRRSDGKPFSVLCCFCSRDSYLFDSDGRRPVVGLIFASVMNFASVVLEVEVHYVAKWRGVTFMTSRQGLGVTGGTPYGFDVGQSENGTVLKGLDLGVEGMRVGGQRLLIVPPELAYGSKGVQEIPPNATIELDVELLSIKSSPFGSSVKLVEG